MSNARKAAWLFLAAGLVMLFLGLFLSAHDLWFSGVWSTSSRYPLLSAAVWIVAACLQFVRARRTNP